MDQLAHDLPLLRSVYMLGFQLSTNNRVRGRSISHFYISSRRTGFGRRCSFDSWLGGFGPFSNLATFSSISLDLLELSTGGEELVFQLVSYEIRRIEFQREFDTALYVHALIPNGEGANRLKAYHDLGFLSYVLPPSEANHVNRQVGR